MISVRYFTNVLLSHAHYYCFKIILVNVQGFMVELDIFSCVVMLLDVSKPANVDELCELVGIPCYYHHLF